MAKFDFGFFGEVLSLQTGSNSITSIGGTAVVLTINLDIPRNTLALKLRGVISGINSDFETIGRIEVQDQRVWLTGLTQSTVRSVTLNLAGIAMPLRNPTLRVADDASIGLEIVDVQGVVLSWLRTYLPVDLYPDLSRPSLRYFADVRAPKLAALPAIPDRPFFEQVDQFQVKNAGPGNPNPFVGTRQRLNIAEIVVTNAGFCLDLRPATGALFAHADVLDTSRRDGNQLLFQYALVNGLLRVEGTTSAANMKWVADASLSADPAILLLRNQDEHGHPVALEFVDREAPLSRREGQRSVVSNKTLPEYWEQVNEALVIGSSVALGATLDLPVRLVQLDPVAVYRAYAEASNPTSVSAPPFIVNGVAKLRAAPPTEIHGLSRGAWLRQSGIKSASASDAKLTIQPLILNHKPAFHLTELVLPDAGAWETLVLREERDLRPDAAPPGASAVGAYLLVGNAGDIRLPAIDLSFALSNLTGNTRRGSGGQRLGQGVLFELGRDRLHALDGQFCNMPTRFDRPKIGDQAHFNGMRVGPAQQVFTRMLDLMPTAAATLAEVSRSAPELKAMVGSPIAGLHLAGAGRTTNVLIFGGEPGDTKTAEINLSPRAKAAEDEVGKAFAVFEKSWRALAGDPLIKPIRDCFSIEQRQRTGVDPVRLSEYQQAAIDYLSSSRNTDDIAPDPQGALRYLNDIPPIEFEEEWADSSDAGLNLLWEHVWAPADLDLLRRIIRCGKAGPQEIAQLFGVSADVKLLARYLFEEPAKGLLADLEQGLDGYWDEVVELWKTSTYSAIKALRDIYGPELTHDVYRQLLALEEDAEAFVQAIRDYLGIELERLADLVPEPPEYVLRTRRFPVIREPGADEKLTNALWSQCFDLCGFDDKQWLFFLDAGSTLIFKLSRKRGLDDILREIVTSYTAPDRPDPLGLERSLDVFLASLDRDLVDPEWVGAFVIRPVADIRSDLVLSDLAGFEHITGSYVAVGGRQQQPGEALIDVWAHIFKQRPADRDLSQASPPPADVKLALTKFDIRIRKTKLSAADIEVEIHPQDILGRTRGVKFPVVVLRGSLEPPAPGNSGSPDLTYAAFFPNPVKLPVELAFINRLELKSLRVARFNGATCIDIDAEMVLQKPVLDIDLGEIDGRKLHLESFRIPLPSVRPMKVEVGELRKLAFDFPAARFSLPNPRTFNLFGVELIPTGVGYVRGDGEPFKRLKRDYIWLNRLDLGSEPNGFVLPYFEMSIDFGKAPTFGGDVRGLKFDAALAFRVDNGSAAVKPYFGLAGLDATEIKFDLFRMLTIEAERLAISKAELRLENDPKPKIAGAILLEKLKLKIFNWSPAPKDARFDLLFLHPSEDDQPSSRKGMLAFYDANLDEAEKRALARKQSRARERASKASAPVASVAAADSFFKVFWILLAHNITLPDKVLSWLLGSNPSQDNPEGMLEKLLKKPADPGDPTKLLQLEGVRLTEQESWLFGISFKLGELFTRGSLVLQDQHYYGIRLSAPWVEAVFGQESIELAYIPGATPEQDRFRTNLRIPALDMLGFLKSGEVAFEWGVNWDFLIDIGFPWRTANGYDWFRAFSIPVGAYEGKIGFYIEKRTLAVQSANMLTLSAGVGFYVGYFFSAGNSVAWVRAGIGVFAILQGTMTFRAPQGNGMMLVKSTLYRAEITGVIGVFAYGEGGVDVWILSARFRVSAQASLACTICYVSGSPCVLTYTANLAARYSASCKVGSGWCSWTFRVSGTVGMPVSGQLLLS